jgi:hypothetical protein
MINDQLNYGRDTIFFCHFISRYDIWTAIGVDASNNIRICTAFFMGYVKKQQCSRNAQEPTAKYRSDYLGPLRKEPVVRLRHNEYGDPFIEKE